MRIYTGTGDSGETGLFGKRRVRKDDVRIEAYGTLDEANAQLGRVRCACPHADLDGRLQAAQETLFEIGADLATEGGRASVPHVTQEVVHLERWIDESEAALPPLRTFVLPAGTALASELHFARTIVRRAERRYWTLRAVCPDVPLEIGIYLNRLSDLLFTWARLANHRAGVADVPWTKR